MTLDEYIKQLENTATDLPKTVKSFVRKNQGKILTEAKLRIYNKGLDGNLKRIGSYSTGTIERRKKKGLRTSFVNLRDSGDWQKGLFAIYENGNLFMGNPDTRLTGKLVDGGGKGGNPAYGDAIMEFTQQEIEKFEELIMVGIDEFIDNQKGGNIDIEI